MAGRRRHLPAHLIAAVVGASLALAGCSQTLSLQAYSLPTGTIPTLSANEPVSVRAGRVDRPGRSFHVSWYDLDINYQEFTDAAVRQLTQDLTQQGIAVTPDAPRSIELSVMYVDILRKFGAFGCVVDYRVTTDDGTVRGLQARESSPTYRTACSAAVAMMAAETLRDPSVAKYLTGQPPPAGR